MPQIVNNGYTIIFSNNQCLIYDPFNKEDKSFSLEWPNSHDTLKTKGDKTWLWHKRFDHYFLNGLKFLHDKQIVLNLPFIYVSNDAYDSCQLEKLDR